MIICGESNPKTWIDTLSALLTPVLGIVGSLILILQFFLQKRRWRLDLYDKRYPVYQATMDYISYVAQHGTINNDEIYKYLRNSKDKSFLFGKDVQEFIEMLYDKGLDLQLVSEELNGLPIGDERKESVKKKSDLFKWFTKQFETSKKLFGAYLRIDNK